MIRLFGFWHRGSLVFIELVFDFSLAASGEEEKLTVRFSAFCKERQILKKWRHNAFTGSILYKMRNDFAFEDRRSKAFVEGGERAPGCDWKGVRIQLGGKEDGTNIILTLFIRRYFLDTAICIG